jgi:L-histidine Nalpha-methyltransferase
MVVSRIEPRPIQPFTVTCSRASPFGCARLPPVGFPIVLVPSLRIRHLARWNDQEARIEMHLEATQEVHFVIKGSHFAMGNGETIHTENSFKYGPRDAGVPLRAGGWTPIADWTDDQALFSIILAAEGAPPAAP